MASDGCPVWFDNIQRPESFAQWCNATPATFQFSVKGSRYITHIRRLRDVEEPLARFFAQGILQLGSKLGPILWQFPPNLSFDVERFADFFALLPSTHDDAIQLVRKHTKAKLQLPTGVQRRKLRHAIEIRHESFINNKFIDMLRQHNVALVVADSVEWPFLVDITADFIYCRLHGSEELYASGYDARALKQWAERISEWRRGSEVKDEKHHASSRAARKRKSRDVYVYFDNDRKVCAPQDAKRLTQMLDK